MLARYYLLGAAWAAALSGCGSSSYTSQYGSTSVAAGTTTGTSGTSNPTGFSGGASGVNGAHDSIVATPPSQVVSVEVGTTKTVSVTMTSSDGRTITGFAISNAAGEIL